MAQPTPEKDRRFWAIGRRKSDYVRLVVEVVLVYKVLVGDISPEALVTLWLSF
jgi:hypothetical protein